MPVRFERERFSSEITQLISDIYTAINNQSRPVLTKHLLNLEDQLVTMYAGRIELAQAKVRAQEVYRALLQSFIHYVCQNIRSGNPEHLCFIIANQALNLFYVEVLYQVGPSRAVLWLDDAEEHTIFDSIDLRGFGTLMQQLVDQAILAITKDSASDETRPLRTVLHIIEMKREWLIHVNAKISVHWYKNEERLSKSWSRLLLSFAEFKITDPQQQQLLRNDQRLNLSLKDREHLARWFDKLQTEIIALIASFPDPTTGKSLIDKERELQQTVASARKPDDPLCFLDDTHPYFYSSIQRLEQQGGRTMISPIQQRAIPTLIQPSNSLKGLYHLSENILNIKRYILTSEDVSIENIAKMAFSVPGHTPRSQLHMPPLAAVGNPKVEPGATPRPRVSFWSPPTQAAATTASEASPPPPYEPPAHPPGNALSG